MEKPKKEQLLGTWESYKLITATVERVIESNIGEWTFYEDGFAEFAAINDSNRITDLNQRTWGISEEPDSEGYYSLLIRKEPWSKIISVDKQDLILATKEIKVVFKKLH